MRSVKPSGIADDHLVFSVLGWVDKLIVLKT